MTKKILVVLVAAAVLVGALAWNRDTSSTTVRASVSSTPVAHRASALPGGAMR